MAPPAFSIRSPVLALAIGVAFFALASVLRAALLPHLAHTPYLGALLTTAVFLMAGALVGALSPRHSLLYGVMLGVLAGVFMTLLIAHFSGLNWTARPTLQILAAFAGMGIILCEIGALAGRAIALRWRSSGYRVERTGE